MVLLHVKQSEDSQFLCELTVNTPVPDAIKELVAINNLRHRLHRLKLEGEELAKYGPAKPLEEQGIDEYQENVVKGEHYLMDPTGRRTGNACAPEAAKTLLKTLADGEQAGHKSQADRKVPLTLAKLEEALDNIRGGVMIAYPVGLPEWDLVRQALEGKEELAGSSHAADDMDPETTTLWFAGKQMLLQNKLSDHVGRHEKSKVVVKLQRKGQGAPGREPPVDAETQKAMMAFYHKKQEEQKRLMEDQYEDYTNSVWANPKALKSHFSGVGNVKIR
ncbi:hypothetical protein WJX72_004678 [[Myrmecia] bisecta]|uniref:Uncharacterized protein n=1 Tax=[Myrmecia] bisecta TaxID=41462 RepID=A0AAW1QQD2_9CHLO